MKFLGLRNSFLKGNFLPFSGPLFWWPHKNVTETVCISFLFISRLWNSLKRKLKGFTRCADSEIEKQHQKKIHWEHENGRIKTPFFDDFSKGHLNKSKTVVFEKKTGTNLILQRLEKWWTLSDFWKLLSWFWKKRVRRLRVKPDGVLAPIFFRCGEETQ